MKKTTLYPFSAACYPVVLYHNKFMPEYPITSVAALPGSGLCGKDVSYAENREQPTGYIVTDDLFLGFKQSDALFVPYGDRKHPAYSDIVGIIKTAITMQKDVLCGIDLDEEEFSEINKLTEISEVKFIHYSKYTPKFSNYTKTFQKISVPVIFVGNAITETNDFELLLALTERLRRDGYKTVTVGVNPELNFWGMFASRELMNVFHKGSLSENVGDCISLLNHEFYSLMLMENPDVMLVQVPGGMLHANELYVNACGVYAYFLSCAVKPDYAICTMLCGMYNEAALKAANDDILSHFGFHVNAFHVSNKAVNLLTSRERKEIRSYYQPETLLQKILTEHDAPEHLYNLLDEEQFEKMYINMIDNLAER